MLYFLISCLNTRALVCLYVIVCVFVSPACFSCYYNAVFVDSSMHCYINYFAKNISRFFLFQNLKNTISKLYAKHFRLDITLLLSNNQAVQISIVSPIISIQNR